MAASTPQVRSRPSSAVCSSRISHLARSTLCVRKHGRPQSACAGSPVRSRYSALAPPATATVTPRIRTLSPLKSDEKGESPRTLAQLQIAFSDIIGLNSDLKSAVFSAEERLNSLLTQSRIGRMLIAAQEQQQNIEDLKVHIHRVEGDNRKMTRKQRLLLRKYREKDLLAKNCKKEIQMMHEVALGMQKEIARRSEQYKMAIARRKSSMEMKIAEASKEEPVPKQRNTTAVCVNAEEVKAESMEQTVTRKLAEERAARFAMLADFLERIATFRESVTILKDEVLKMRHEMDETQSKGNKSFGARMKIMSKKIHAVAKSYNANLEELTANNVAYKKQNEEIRTENEALREENSKLLESLLAYLLLSQKADSVANTKLEDALLPLCPKADRLRVPTPRDEKPAVKKIKTLAEQLYPPGSPTGGHLPDFQLYSSKEDALFDFQLNMPEILRKAGLDTADCSLEL